MKVLSKMLATTMAIAMLAGTMMFASADANLATSAKATDDQNGTNQGYSAEEVKNHPDNLIDGDYDGDDGCWRAHNPGGTDSGEWNVYLEWDAAQTFDNVVIYFEDCHGVDFTINVSNDGENWTEVKKVTGNTEKNGLKVAFDEQTATHLNVCVTKKGNADWAVGIYELEVYNGEGAGAGTGVESFAVWAVVLAVAGAAVVFTRKKVTE